MTLAWESLPPLNQARYWHAVLIDTHDVLYAIGGSAGFLLNSVERLDTRNPSAGWTFGTPMPTARMVGGACVGKDGRFYLVGGWTGTWISTVEVYDPASDSWSSYAPLNRANTLMGVVTGVSGRIYSTGGERADSGEVGATAAVEYTDPYPLQCLTVLSPPVNQLLNVGSNVTFSVRATGTSPLTYKWLYNGTPIVGATTAALVVTNAGYDQIGFYSVVVSNACTTTNLTATLSFLDLKMYAELTLAGPVGTKYEVQYLNDIHNTNEWRTLATVTLPNSPYLWFDVESGTLPKRFYRAVLVP